MLAIQVEHLRRDADDERPRAIYRVSLDLQTPQAAVEAQESQSQFSANVVLAQVEVLEPRQVFEPLARLQQIVGDAQRLQPAASGEGVAERLHAVVRRVDLRE